MNLRLQRPQSTGGHGVIPEVSGRQDHSLKNRNIVPARHCSSCGVGKILLMMSFLAIDVPSLMEPSFASPTLFE